MTLTEFLLARIAEDEASVVDWPTIGSWGLHSPGHMWTSTYGLPIYAPRARVLAECEAKRRIVDLHGMDHDCQMPSRYNQALLHAGNGFRPCPTLRALALPYADHPDYREEWKP